VSLEAAFWQALCEIAARRMSINALLSTIDAERSGNLSSAVRLFVLECQPPSASCLRWRRAGGKS
jgi:predicted DNA-binding ribbon-helix-helix protein